MFRSFLNKLSRNHQRRTARRKVLPTRTLSDLESLDNRILLAVTATFSPSAGVLSVFGDSQSNNIDISRDAAGKLLVNGGAVTIKGGTPTVANVALIQVFGQGGSDNISMNEANGALPRANLFGGEGNDTLTGGSGADQLFGQGGSDTILGKGGFDLLFGGGGSDFLTGGDGDDQVFGESGNDRMIWNPGDDTDLNEGGGGVDTVEVNGGNGAESFTVVPNGTRVRFDRIDPAPFSIDIGTSENLILNANGGNDSFTAANGLATLIQITVDGGEGNDTINGGDGADLLLGGNGNDFIDGNRGNDTAMLGAGDDLFQWDPGDGSDVVEGQAGQDTMLFNGANIAEQIDLSAVGERLRLSRDIGNITMDTNDVEDVKIKALGGADKINVNDLSGTDVVAVEIDLAASTGSGDGLSDTVNVKGTAGNDTVEIPGANANYSVVGLPALVTVSNSEGANDNLTVDALAGNDIVNAETLPAEIVRLTIDGDAGADSVIGSRGDDMLIGGQGNDFVDGNPGADVALLGDGDDVFVWNPGDANDVIEGGAGTDEMLFNGAGISEQIDMSANGERFRFSRNVANVTMDTNDVERVTFNALGGSDEITVNDLTGTDVTVVQINLNNPGQANDGSVDKIFVSGTNGDDTIVVASANGEVAVTGLAAQVKFTGIDAGLDELQVNGQGGTDLIDASGLDANLVKFTALGGLGNDLMIGSPGDDMFVGNDGDDVVLMGAGDDTFVWNPGDDNDTLEGQDGFDTMLFNGNGASERIDISAVGERVRFTRDVATVVMDLNDVERINFKAAAAVDNITINDLAGTDVVEVNVDLSLVAGLGDGQIDTVIVNGTNGDDVILAVGDASGVSVLGLAVQVNITGAEVLDRLSVFALTGDDVVEGSGLSAGAMSFIVDAGAGDDVIIGGAGADMLLGADGDDVLIGGSSLDVLDGGNGDNILIQD